MSETGWNLRMADSMTAASVAHRFYIQGKTKSQIAEESGLSRFKVARILEAVRKTGLVRVEFELPLPVDLELSEAVRAAYGLRRALVLNRAESCGDRPELRRRIGALAARFLAEFVSPSDVIGLAWARSVNAMADFLPRLPRCPVVQLCGVQAGMDMRDRSVETVSRVAQASGGQACPIYGPLVLPDRRTTEILRQQPGIAETFERFRDLTKAVVSIGAWEEGESTVHDALRPRERELLRQQGAAAEIAARLFDADGNELETELEHRVLAIAHDQLRAVDEVIALGYTEPKAGAIDAVLRSGVVTTLVTDAHTADLVLERAAE